MTDGCSISRTLPAVNQFASPLAQKASILGFFTVFASTGSRGGDIYRTAVPKE